MPESSVKKCILCDGRDKSCREREGGFYHACLAFKSSGCGLTEKQVL